MTVKREQVLELQERAHVLSKRVRIAIERMKMDSVCPRCGRDADRVCTHCGVPTAWLRSITAFGEHVDRFGEHVQRLKNDVPAPVQRSTGDDDT